MDLPNTLKNILRKGLSNLNDETLADLKNKVNQAEALQLQIKALDEVIASCKAEVGFLNIIANYKNQNEVNLVASFPVRNIFDGFKLHISDAATELKGKLETEFKNLK